MQIIKLTLLMAITLLLSGCFVDESKPYVTVPIGQGEVSKLNYTIITVDGCEYVYFGYGGAVVFTHKGDCKNPIHIYNVESGTEIKQITNSSAITNPSVKVESNQVMVSSGNSTITIKVGF